MGLFPTVIYPCWHPHYLLPWPLRNQMYQTHLPKGLIFTSAPISSGWRLPGVFQWSSAWCPWPWCPPSPALPASRCLQGQQPWASQAKSRPPGAPPVSSALRRHGWTASHYCLRGARAHLGRDNIPRERSEASGMGKGLFRTNYVMCPCSDTLSGP